jgi:ABC-type multidrug transport system fused ATPase/permease subunit
MIRAAKMANIYDFIQSQPKKFKTQVGERGLLLSGGEKQRLVLARNLARSPKILALDEATSALDNKSELMIQNAIDGLKGKVTMIVIAHRLTTLLNCDKIIFLEGGKIQEEGKPDDLLRNKNSRFYKLYNIRENIK